MKLYHGSNLSIDKINLSCSNTGKDFGCGFYLSSDISQATKQAEIKTFRLQKGEPTVSIFEFDEKKLADKSLKVKIFDGYTVEWAEFILMNRTNLTRTQAHDYDIVYGPIADDTVGVQLRRFLENYISINQLVEELKHSRGITFQYFFGTEKAISLLKKS